MRVADDAAGHTHRGLVAGGDHELADPVAERHVVQLVHLGRPDELADLAGDLEPPPSSR
ncbi:hypothetical protein [Janibacter hoylei]|uniref:hypothetical protein n=1 Tax=Janibacter hoylei TaxID=364298 RepID=UPI0027B94F03|nr:hypothetical protein [Janibacter hoylei]